MQKLTFDLTVEEANLILEGLGKLPFERVFSLVNNIQEQANKQISNKQTQNGNGIKSDVPPTKPVLDA